MLPLVDDDSPFPPIATPFTHPTPPIVCADRLLSQYRTGMDLEKEFFSSQPLAIKQRPLGMIVVDFDETVTLADTTGCIAKAVIDAVTSKVRGGSPFVVLAGGIRLYCWDAEGTR